MIKMIHGGETNITEHATTNQYDVRSAIAEGYITARGINKKDVNTDILEQFGITLSTHEDTVDIVQSLITENNFNPLLTIYHLQAEKDVEGIKAIREAYEQFVEVVNSYSTDDISKKNANLINNVIETVNLAIAK